MKRWGVLLGVLAASLALPALTAAQRVSEEYGYDRVGDDYNSFQADSLQQCKASCSRDSRCRAYTFLSRKGECYLKKQANPAQRSKDAITGVKEGGGDWGGGGLTEERGYDRRGNDYTSFRARELSECKRACSREQRCQAYTFDTRNGDCYLKDKINKGERNGVMVTGYKGSSEGGRPEYPGGGGGIGSLTEESGLDRRGNDYTSFRARSLSSCKQECREDNRCQAYTFNTRTGDCYLKDRINRAEPNGGMVTGYKGSGGPNPGGGGQGRLTEEEGLDRRGDDYDSFRAQNLSACQRECRDDRRCQAYTFLFSSRTCFLKSRINKAQGNRDAVTGYKQTY